MINRINKAKLITANIINKAQLIIANKINKKTFLTIIMKINMIM